MAENSFFETLKKRNNYSPESVQCMKDIIKELTDKPTDYNKPGMLLGKIQSGKTRTFIGAMALAFDSGFGVVVILTKNNKALTRQTVSRLNRQFEDFIKADLIQLYDIMSLPPNLTRYEQAQKIIIIVKKQKDNLNRLNEMFFTDYPALNEKKVLIIDDEADYASVGFKYNTSEIAEQRVIADSINTLRHEMNDGHVLQVTATPYSLYLQPDDAEIRGEIEPQKPSFTIVMPEGPGYIGGEYYFDASSESSSPASHMYIPVEPAELEVLFEQDGRKFDIRDSLNSDAIATFRDAIVNFITGSSIRMLQDVNDNKMLEKHSFIIHTEFRRDSHSWQEEIALELLRKLESAAKNHPLTLRKLIQKSYDSLAVSVQKAPGNLFIPDFEKVFERVSTALNDGEITTAKVNSERDVEDLLDGEGELRLRTPMNIFIGGQILDRGLTISNLIGFFYGRRPQRFQQDTVLQHCRMYGYRKLADLAITRIYTALEIHRVMRNIYEFDSELRNAFLRGGHNRGVIFLRQDDSRRVVPCSPNKILISTVTTLRAHKRMLPFGFTTKPKKYSTPILNELDQSLDKIENTVDKNGTCCVDLKKARCLIEATNEQFEYEKDFEWDLKPFLASLEYLSKNTSNSRLKNCVNIIIHKGRKMQRFQADGTYTDAPDSAKDNVQAKKAAIDIPVIIMMRQDGKEELGWKGQPFWWPVLYVPRNINTVLFANDVADMEKK